MSRVLSRGRRPQRKPSEGPAASRKAHRSETSPREDRGREDQGQDPVSENEGRDRHAPSHADILLGCFALFRQTGSLFQPGLFPPGRDQVMPRVWGVVRGGPGAGPAAQEGTVRADGKRPGQAGQAPLELRTARQPADSAVTAGELRAVVSFRPLSGAGGFGFPIYRLVKPRRHRDMCYLQKVTQQVRESVQGACAFCRFSSPLCLCQADGGRAFQRKDRRGINCLF